MQRAGQCRNLAAAVASQDDVVGEQRLKSTEVAVAGGGEERRDHLLPDREVGVRNLRFGLHPPASAAGELAGCLR